MITRDEILKGQQIPQELEENLKNLLIALNKFCKIYGQPIIVNSGYRTPEHNTKIGGSPNSRHCLCMAADFRDNDNKLKEFCKKDDYQVLKDCGLYMEDTTKTPTWVHLDIDPRQTREFKIRS